MKRVPFLRPKWLIAGKPHTVMAHKLQDYILPQSQHIILSRNAEAIEDPALHLTCQRGKDNVGMTQFFCGLHSGIDPAQIHVYPDDHRCAVETCVKGRGVIRGWAEVPPQGCLC